MIILSLSKSLSPRCSRGKNIHGRTGQARVIEYLAAIRIRKQTAECNQPESVWFPLRHYWPGSRKNSLRRPNGILSEANGTNELALYYLFRSGSARLSNFTWELGIAELTYLANDHKTYRSRQKCSCTVEEKSQKMIPIG